MITETTVGTAWAYLNKERKKQNMVIESRYFIIEER